MNSKSFYCGQLNSKIPCIMKVSTKGCTSNFDDGMGMDELSRIVEM